MEAIIVRTKTSLLVSMCGTWADYTGGGIVKTKPQRTLVMHKSRTTDGKSTGSK